MHSPLERYLRQVNKNLGPLPEKRREIEIEEIHQHLLQTMAANQALGLSEAEAGQNAMNELGAPEEIADDVNE